MKSKNRPQRRKRAGFSLAETLVALLIILLVSSIVAAGMPAAQKALLNVKESANAQVFLSTTLSELRNKLSTASEIKVVGNRVSYVDPVTGNSVIELRDDNKLWITENMDLNANGTLAGGVSRPLVSDAAAGSLSLVFDNGTPFPTSPPAYTKGDRFFTVSGFGVQSSLIPNSVLARVTGYKIAIIVP